MTAPRCDPVFQARGLAKVYHVGEVDVHALRGVDLTLGESEFVVLLGPSGSGKNTDDFFNLASEMYYEAVTSGISSHVRPSRRRPATFLPTRRPRTS